MPETLQQLKVRTAREIRQRTAARIARLRGEEDSSDEDSDKDKDERKKRKVFVVHDYSVVLLVLLFLFCLIVLLLVINLFYLQHLQYADLVANALVLHLTQNKVSVESMSRPPEKPKATIATIALPVTVGDFVQVRHFFFKNVDVVSLLFLSIGRALLPALYYIGGRSGCCKGFQW